MVKKIRDTPDFGAEMVIAEDGSWNRVMVEVRHLLRNFARRMQNIRPGRVRRPGIVVEHGRKGGIAFPPFIGNEQNTHSEGPLQK